MLYNPYIAESKNEVLFTLAFIAELKFPLWTIPNSESIMISAFGSSREGVSKEHEYPEKNTIIGNATASICTARKKYFSKTPGGKFGRQGDE